MKGKKPTKLLKLMLGREGSSKKDLQEGHCFAPFSNSKLQNGQLIFSCIIKSFLINLKNYHKIILACLVLYLQLKYK